MQRRYGQVWGASNRNWWTGIAYVTQNAAARFSCKVLQQVDLGTHVMFIGEVLAAEILSDEDVMTYAYYQTVKRAALEKRSIL